MPEIRLSPDETMIAYRMGDAAGQSNTPWLMLALTARGEQQGRFTDDRVADWTPLVPQDRVTCPWCGREDRALTSTGRIRRHQRGPAEPGAAVVCKGTGRKPSEYRAPSQQRTTDA